MSQHHHPQQPFSSFSKFVIVRLLGYAFPSDVPEDDIRQKANVR